MIPAGGGYGVARRWASRRGTAIAYTPAVDLAASAPPPEPGGRSLPASLRERLCDDARYAVVDVETTGLDPRVHRVVECAVVELDRHGTVTDEWASLVAIPGSDELGATWIHGITRSMLAGAPTFGELLAELVRRLSGRVVVGHVLSFDLGHLATEFHRAGAVLPDAVRGGICTRDLARNHLPPGRRSLELCCAAAGVPIADAHTALGDARAAAGLLRWFIGEGHAREWQDRVAGAMLLAWPEVEPEHGRPRSVAVPRSARARPPVG